VAPYHFSPRSSNGRTTGSGPVNLGSNPSLGTKWYGVNKALRNAGAGYKKNFRDKKFILSVVIGGLFLAASLAVNHISIAYINQIYCSPLHDILLDNLPVLNVNFIVNEGVWLGVYFIVFFILSDSKRIPFTLKSLASFILIRSIFITLTHMQVVPNHSYLNPNDWLSNLAGGNDMFFSGHTGMPFLLALTFWDHKFVRAVMLAASAILGSAMLLGHLHYSIDVFSAFFITYTIYEINKKLFQKDYEFSMLKVAYAPTNNGKI
jgi:hypothetical protein